MTRPDFVRVAPTDVDCPQGLALPDAFLAEALATFDRQSKPGSHRLNATDLHRRVPVKINRNFLNFPLARDTRTKADWFEDSQTGRWMADLPGEGRDTHRIQLILSAKADEECRRCPSALDMNVLFQLLAEAQQQDATARIEFASFAVLLRRLGLEERDRERARVVSSIVYWSQLWMRWDSWYERRGHIPHKLPPPIEDADREGNRIIIRLHPDWYNLARAQGYYLWLPLPLPPKAVVQNLVLLILTQQLEDGNLGFDMNEIEADWYFDRMAPLTKGMDRWWIARKLGLLHKQRNRVLDRAIDQAAKWFAVNRGKLNLVAATAGDEDTPSGRIAFRYAKPQVPRRKSSMGRSRGPLHPFGRRLSRPRWPVTRTAIIEQNRRYRNILP